MANPTPSAEVARFPTFDLLTEALGIFMHANHLTPAEVADVLVRGIVSAQADGQHLTPLVVMWGKTGAIDFSCAP